MASIRQLPSGRFNVQIRRGNKKAQGTFDTREQAEAWAIEQERKRKRSSTGEADGPPLLLRTLGETYCNTVLGGKPSRVTAMHHINRLVANLPIDVRQISWQDVNAYRLARLREVSPTTCRDELLFLNRVFRWAYRERLLDRVAHPSPCADIPKPKPNAPRNKVISRAELEMLLSFLRPTMRSVVELAYETAMRRSEIVKLTPSDLQLEERTLKVVRGKTGDRYVPLTNRAAELLGEAASKCPSPHTRLFPIEPHSVSTAVRRAREKAGLGTDVRLHQLRHTRITMAARKGMNTAMIMMVSGHKDVRSVQRYTHLNVRDVIELLD